MNLGPAFVILGLTMLSVVFLDLCKIAGELTDDHLAPRVAPRVNRAVGAKRISIARSTVDGWESIHGPVTTMFRHVYTDREPVFGVFDQLFALHLGPWNQWLGRYAKHWIRKEAL